MKERGEEDSDEVKRKRNSCEEEIGGDNREAEKSRGVFAHMLVT